MPDLSSAERGGTRRSVLARLSGVAGLLLLAMALWVRWRGVSWNGVDLRVYLAGARAVSAGHPLYLLTVSDGYGGILQFSYPPFAALVFVPLLWTGAAAAATLTVASVVSYGVVGWLCARAVGWGVRGAALLLVVGLILEPVQRTLLYGQVNLVLAALVLLDVYLVPRAGRGWLIGLAAGVKLTPAIFVFYYLVRRDWVAAARVGVSFAATVAVGWVMLPADSARFWLHGLGSMSQFGSEVDLWGNQSISAVVDRAAQLHGVPSSIESLVVWVLCGLTLVFALTAAWFQSKAGDHLATVVVLGLAGLLVSPVSWTHHWVWVLPAIALMVRRRWRVLPGATVALFFLPPMWALVQRPNSQLGYTVTDLALSAAFALWAVLVLALMFVDGLKVVRGIQARSELTDASPHQASPRARMHV